MTGEELDELMKSLKVLSNGDIITPEGEVVGHCDISEMLDNTQYGISIKYEQVF